MTPGQESYIDLSPEMAAAFGRIIHSLGPDRLVLFADLLEDVISNPGYGEVKIIINRKAVALLRAEKSYRYSEDLRKP